MSYVKKFYEKKLDNLTFFVYICNNGIDYLLCNIEFDE